MGADSVVAHITNFSWPSAYVSFTASPAIARRYAQAARDSGGKVFEIEATGLPLVDPVLELARAYGGLAAAAAPWILHHEGDRTLIAAVAAAEMVFERVSHRRESMHRPSCSRHLQALIWAIRDAEVLIAAPISPACVVDVWEVH